MHAGHGRLHLVTVINMYQSQQNRMTVIRLMLLWCSSVSSGFLGHSFEIKAKKFANVAESLVVHCKQTAYTLQVTLHKAWLALHLFLEARFLLVKEREDWPSRATMFVQRFPLWLVATVLPESSLGMATDLLVASDYSLSLPCILFHKSLSLPILVNFVFQSIRMPLSSICQVLLSSD